MDMVVYEIMVLQLFHYRSPFIIVAIKCLLRVLDLLAGSSTGWIIHTYMNYLC